MSDGKISKLRVVVASPDAELVSRIEECLELARSGELVSFYGCGGLADGGVLTTVGASEDRWRDLAALERLKHRIFEDMS